MQNNRNTESETPYLDSEDWHIALEPYEGNPSAALNLGIALVELKKRITDLNIHDALEAIDVGIDCLYSHSDFHGVGRGLFESAIEGKLSPDKESLLSQLGMAIEDEDE